MLASDADREQAAEALREHYVRGRIGLEGLSTRTELVLAAHSRRELRAALDGLPVGPDLVRHGRNVAAAAVRGLALVALTAAHILFTVVLVIVLALVLVIHGATGPELVGVLVLWLVPTFLLSRLWRRGLRRERGV
jgi:hypothetical protein